MEPSERTVKDETPSEHLSRLEVGWLFVAVLAMILLRVFALDSDAFPHLSWSSALLTDEGFYIHNARNVALFHHATTDQFNNMLIMPTLHWVQMQVFAHFGSGSVQARSISVVAGLLTLPVLFYALKASFGVRVAAVALLFCGLGHANLMYSRMALMDPSAALLMVCSFAIWSAGVQSHQRGKPRSMLLFAACGALLSVVYITRGLSAFIIPIGPCLMLVRARTASDAADKSAWYRDTGSLFLGLALGMTVYLKAWYLPHHAEISRMTHYYLSVQLAPHSLGALRMNIVRAAFGDFRGMSHYLFAHSAVEFGLCVSVIGAFFSKGRIGLSAKLFAARHGADEVWSQMCGWFMVLWLLCAWSVYACASYAPDRYYVLFYPAMCSIAALALCRIRVLRVALEGGWARTAIAAFLVFHFTETLLHHQEDWLVAGMVLLAIGVYSPYVHSAFDAVLRILAPAPLLVIWGLVHLGWTGNWLVHMSYLRRDVDHWLQKSLPAGSVIIGDVAPGLCLDNHFVAVNVIPGLCNYDRPLEQFSGHPLYVAILDQRMVERYWRKQYPDLLTVERRIALFPNMLNRPVGVFRVDLAPPPNGALPVPGQAH